jgi:hypothetical protein
MTAVDASRSSAKTKRPSADLEADGAIWLCAMDSRVMPVRKPRIAAWDESPVVN